MLRTEIQKMVENPECWEEERIFHLASPRPKEYSRQVKVPKGRKEGNLTESAGSQWTGPSLADIRKTRDRHQQQWAVPDSLVLSEGPGSDAYGHSVGTDQSGTP